MDIEKIILEIKTDWKDILLELIQPYKNKINDLYNTKEEIYPDNNKIFDCFNYFNINDLQVIILGQDPYQNTNYANGLCFSTPNTLLTKTNKKFIPASLKNIFKELKNNYNKERIDTDLSDWSLQGVLLLNVSLSVIKDKSGSHLHIWKDFTNDILNWISCNLNNKICIMLWGNYAKSYSYIFNKTNFYILEHTHPSPLSRKPFIGNNHFILCNNFITKPIIWL